MSKYETNKKATLYTLGGRGGKIKIPYILDSHGKLKPFNSLGGAFQDCKPCTVDNPCNARKKEKK